MMQVSATFTATAYPKDSRVPVEILASKDGTDIQIAQSAISGNSVTLNTRSSGGSGGSTGIVAPYDLTFQTVVDGETGTLYTVHVVVDLPEADEE